MRRTIPRGGRRGGAIKRSKTTTTTMTKRTCWSFKKKHISKSGRREGQIRTVNKRERTDSFFHFFI